MANRVDSATFLAAAPAPLPVMAWNDDTRQQLLDLVGLGVSQKTLASELQVSDSWLSRWLNNEPRKGQKAVVRPKDAKSLTMQQAERLLSYLRKLSLVIHGPSAPIVADGMKLIRLAERIDSVQRPVAIRAMEELIARQKPSEGDAPVPASPASRTALPAPATPRGKPASFVRKAVAGGRNRRP